MDALFKEIAKETIKFAPGDEEVRLAEHVACEHEPLIC